MEYLFLFIIWTLYFLLHSFLASNYSKIYIQKNILSIYPFYRICYNLVAFFFLLLVLGYQGEIKPYYLFKSVNFSKIVGYIIIFMGIIIGSAAFKNYNQKEFLGLDFNKKTKSTNKLNTTGLNNYVRHPLYFATLVIIWGYFISNPILSILMMNGVISIYLIIGTKLEEQKLLTEFGKKYQQYIDEVPMLLPKLKL